MFDTPDLAPLCYAPFVAIIAGIIVYGISNLIGVIIKKRSNKNLEWWNTLTSLLFIFSVPIACFSSVVLGIGAEKTSHGCTPLPNEFTVEDLIGTWHAESSLYPKSSDTLIIREDGKYKQTIEREYPFAQYESEWQSWEFEHRPNGTGYLHLEGLRECAIRSDISCEWVNDGTIPQANVCENQYIEPDPVGKSVLVVRGYPVYDPNDKDSDSFNLTLFQGFESSPWIYHFEMP